MDRGKKSIFVDLTDNGSGGGGLAISNSHIFETTTARDTYFTTNPTEKKVGVMISVGSGYQEWSGTAWTDKTAVVKGAKGDTGPAGPTGPQGPQGPAGTGTGTGSGLPTGGTTGQVLKKKSATDGDADWEDEATGTGSTSLLDPVADLTALKAIDTTSFTTVKEIQVTSLGLYKFQPVQL